MVSIFIDTNIYLNFYHFSDDELEELKKLSVAIKKKDIKLYITRQVINEFNSATKRYCYCLKVDLIFIGFCSRIGNAAGGVKKN